MDRACYRAEPMADGPILVTGATGFVGRAVVAELLRRGSEVVAFTRSVPPDGRYPGRSGLRWKRADLDEPRALASAVAEVAPRSLLHLAWRVESDYLDSAANTRCAEGSIALVHAFARVGGTRIVGIGSALEYAPRTDDHDESGAVDPIGSYGRAKDQVHRALCDTVVAARGQLTYAWARLFNVYGPSDHDWALVPSLLRAHRRGTPIEFGGGAQVRGWLHVSDAARAIADLLSSDVAGAVDVGDPVPRTLTEVAHLVAVALGPAAREGVVRFGARARSPIDADRRVTSAYRLRSELGFRPAVAFEDGVRRVVASDDP